MMYDVEVGGRLRKVALQRKGDRFTVTIDGRAHVVDVKRPDARTLSLLVPDEGSGQVRSWDVGIGEGTDGQLAVHVSGVRVPVRVTPSRGAWGRRRADGAGASLAGPARVVAPMPGRIVRLLVVAGDEVSAGQGLIVVEAMKMENELRSPKEGRVREVRAAEGASVEAGAVLVVVD